jgi:TetR/AcrR family fatty acid metabolism transcriptional regulator
MQNSRTAQHHGVVDDMAPKQRQILRSTYKMMGVKGVNQLALQDVADDAGVSKALLLYHFKTKESLILATLEWVLNRVAERIRVAIAPVETAEAKVGAMIDAIFIRPDLNREFYLVYCDLIGYAARLDNFSAVAITFHDTVNQMYADVVAMGMQEGVFPTRDAGAAGAVVRALIDGLFVQWLLDRDWEATHQSYREFCKRSILTYLRTV